MRILLPSLLWSVAAITSRASVLPSDTPPSSADLSLDRPGHDQSSLERDPFPAAPFIASQTPSDDHVNLRRRQSNKGLYADTTTCSPAQVAAINQALSGVASLASAALKGIEHVFVGDDPFTGFFGHYPNSKVDRTITPITNVFTRAIEYANGDHGVYGLNLFGFTGDDPSSPIRLTCKNEYRTCVSGKKIFKLGSRISAQYVEDTNTIVLCPIFFEYPSTLNQPCTNSYTTNGLEGIGAIGQPLILLREFARAIRNNVIQDYVMGTEACLDLQEADDLLWVYPMNIFKFWEPREFIRIKPMINADSYARYAAWAYDLGFESIDTEGQKICLGYWGPSTPAGIPPWVGEEVSLKNWNEIPPKWAKAKTEPPDWRLRPIQNVRS